MQSQIWRSESSRLAAELAHAVRLVVLCGMSLGALSGILVFLFSQKMMAPTAAVANMAAEAFIASWTLDHILTGVVIGLVCSLVDDRMFGSRKSL